MQARPAVEEVAAVPLHISLTVTQARFERERAWELLGSARLWDALDHHVCHQAFLGDPEGGAALVKGPLVRGEQLCCWVWLSSEVVWAANARVHLCPFHEREQRAVVRRVQAMLQDF
jgi:hypothetical protein